MANAIAESLLALLAGAAPAYANTRARRGQENRDLQQGLATDELTQKRTEKKEAVARDERAVDRYSENTYRARVLAGQEEDRKSDREFKEKQLKLQKEQIDNTTELRNAQQDFQNRQAIMQRQIEGFQSLITLLRAQGDGKKTAKTPQELYQAEASKGALDIITSPEIIPEKAQMRIDNMKKVLKEIYGITDEEAAGADDPIAAAIEAAKAIAGGGAAGGTGGIVPLGQYPNSPLGGFSDAPTDSEFEMGRRYRLNTLVP